MADEALRHDAFISFSNADRAWAIRLHRDLKERGFRIFSDQELRVGEEWEQRLVAELEASRHLIVLWSDKAAQSDYVNAELARFVTLTEGRNDRQLLQVNLQGRNRVYARLFAIDTLKNAHVYPGDPDKLDPKLWEQTLAPIVEVLARTRESAKRAAPRSVSTQVEADDYAIVIGTPTTDDRWSAATDKATSRMRAWLNDPNGGRVAAERTFTALSVSGEQADRLLDRFVDQHSGRSRRLYLYFRGTSADARRAIYVLPNRTEQDRLVGIDVLAVADYFKRSGAFEQVVMIADVRAKPAPVNVQTSQWAAKDTPGNLYASHFYAIGPLEAELDGSEGLTAAFIDLLRSDSSLNGAQVETELITRMRPAPHISTGGAPILFGPRFASDRAKAADDDDLRERVSTHSDAPALVDRLGRKPFAEVLGLRIEEIRKTDQAKAPRVKHKRPEDDQLLFMINLHGPWGSGKTTVLRLLRAYLQDEERSIDKRWVVVDFNAWQYQRLQPPWWNLIKEVYSQALAQMDAQNSLVLRAGWLWWRVLADFVPTLVAMILVALAALFIYGAIERTPAAASPTQGKTVFEALNLSFTVLGALLTTGAALVAFSRTLLFGSAEAARLYVQNRRDPLKPIVRLFNRLIRTIGRPVIIYIDDADRCDATYMVQLLEGIQTLFKCVPVTYVVSGDRRWISTCFESKYTDFAKQLGQPGRPLGHLFLDKAFQVSVAVPQLSRHKRDEFFKYLLEAEDGPIDPQAVEAREKENEERALADMQGIKTSAPLQGKIDEAAATGDPVKEQAARAAAAKQITSPEALTAAEHRFQGFSPLLESNPRAMKRFVNAVGLRQAALFLEGRRIPQNVVARWTIVESRWPILAEFRSKSHRDRRRKR